MKIFSWGPYLEAETAPSDQIPELGTNCPYRNRKDFETKMIIRTFIKTYLFLLISWKTVNAGVVQNSVEKRDVGGNQKWAQKLREYLTLWMQAVTFW